MKKITDILWVPEDFETHHHYYADEKGEKEYTGTTSVLGVIAKPSLIPWAARMACEHVWENRGRLTEDQGDGAFTYNCLEDEKLKVVLEEARIAHTKKKEAAGEHGTDTHALVEEYVNYCLKSFDGQPVNDYAFDGDDAILKFKAWAVENVDHFLFSERRMANKDLWLAGTADFAYISKDGKRMMADFKTSSGIYGLEYWMQTAAYRLLAEGEGDAPYDGQTIVRLGKDGSFEVQHRYAYDVDRSAFLAALTIYRAQQTYVKPK